MSSVWITGAHGFVGRNLARHLHANGSVIYGLGHGAWPSVQAESWGVSYWINGELTASNFRTLQDCSGRPDIIYHLAGGSSVGLSFDHPLEDFSRTVASTANMLDWVRCETPESRVIAVSSAAVYGADYTDSIKEESPLHPYSPYGFHKAMMEMECRSYVENFGLDIVITRLFSVYGAGLEKQLIWDLCRKLNNTVGLLTLGGTGNERRDWIHISDACRLLDMLRDRKLVTHGIINGGTGEGVSIADIAALIVNTWGSDFEITFSGSARPGDPPVLVADVARLSELGFQPGIDLESGMREYVEWYKREYQCP